MRSSSGSARAVWRTSMCYHRSRPGPLTRREGSITCCDWACTGLPPEACRSSLFDCRRQFPGALRPPGLVTKIIRGIAPEPGSSKVPDHAKSPRGRPKSRCHASIITMSPPVVPIAPGRRLTTPCSARIPIDPAHRCAGGHQTPKRGPPELPAGQKNPSVGGPYYRGRQASRASQSHPSPRGDPPDVSAAATSERGPDGR